MAPGRVRLIISFRITGRWFAFNPETRPGEPRLLVKPGPMRDKEKGGVMYIRWTETGHCVWADLYLTEGFLWTAFPGSEPKQFNYRPWPYQKGLNAEYRFPF